MIKHTLQMMTTHSLLWTTEECNKLISFKHSSSSSIWNM